MKLGYGLDASWKLQCPDKHQFDSFTSHTDNLAASGITLKSFREHMAKAGNFMCIVAISHAVRQNLTDFQLF